MRTVDVDGHAIHVKLALHDGRVLNAQPEYDDVVRAADGRPAGRSRTCWPTPSPPAATCPDPPLSKDHMDLGIIAVTFGAIFIVELPDKTFIAALVLSTRYRPLAVWLGVGLAFGVQTLVAVTAGALATLLPGHADQERGAADLPASARSCCSAPLRAPTPRRRSRRRSTPPRRPSPKTFLKAAVASFLVLFAAEWGDLSQLLTISFVDPLPRPRQRLHRRVGRRC